MKATSIDAYLSDVPPEKKAALQKVRALVKKTVPKATETMAWGMPMFKYNGKYVLGFCAFKEHCSIFPMSGRILTRYKPKLDAFAMSKGTIRFTPDKPIPASIVKAIVKDRMKEIDAGQKKA
jgi:uncharacterized protein YdhG (YjbR/CyaY superfamily)